MASRFGQLARSRILDPSRQRRRAGASLTTQPQALEVNPPWGGFTPDLSPVYARPSDAQECFGLIQRSGQLRPPDGFARIDSARLPLDSGAPIIGMFQFFDDTGTGNQRKFAWTSGSPGSLFELVSGVWTERAQDAGATAFSSSTAALLEYAHITPDGDMVFTNNETPVQLFDKTDDEYDDFSPVTLAPFIARTVMGFGDRIVFGNTSEAGTRNFRRVRFTTVGSGPALTGLGSGFLDFDEVDGELLKLLPIGNLGAGYFDSGVVFLTRTGNAAAPFDRIFVNQQRGLLGTKSVVDLGRGEHFGIYDDGWWILNDRGQFRQLGRRRIGDGTYETFTDTFYARLNWDAKNRVYCEYDRESRQTHIVWPADDNTVPSEYWIYDNETDSVWPDSLANVPNVFGRFNTETSALTWVSAGAPATWEEDGTWGEGAQKIGQERIVHGTQLGVVNMNDPAIFTKDGATPSYVWRSHRKLYGSHTGIKVWERLALRYRQLSGAMQPAINILFHTEDGSVSGVVQTNRGAGGSDQIDYSHARISGTHLGVEINGSHPVRIQSMEISFTDQGSEVRR